MIVERFCKQCGRLAKMEVDSQSSSRRYCDDCRRKRAIQATLRWRDLKKRGAAKPDNLHIAVPHHSVVRKVRFHYNKDGALVAMEVVS